MNAEVNHFALKRRALSEIAGRNKREERMKKEGWCVPREVLMGRALTHQTACPDNLWNILHERYMKTSALSPPASAICCGLLSSSLSGIHLYMSLI